MKQSIQLVNRWRNIINTVLRFPVTTILLLAAAITNTLAIILSKYEPYNNITLALGIGALIYAVFQLLFERFFDNKTIRYIFMTSTIFLSLLYYLYINNTRWGTEAVVRTLVIFFILIILFIWVPSIKNRFNFNQSFMTVFKSFFMTIFFNGVLFIGTVIIFATIDLLLFNVSEKAYLHSANIIFVLIAPIYLLSYIPVYPGVAHLIKAKLTHGAKELEKAEASKEAEALGEAEEADEKERFNDENNENNDIIDKITVPGKFLETLISYIIIPITAAFTLILFIYIIMNITGSFWTNNLLEPMLVAYSIIVIIVYLLTSTIDNAWTRNFRRVFPKVLVFVVLFQTISSVLRISELGITYGRYYVILFGIFSTIAGIVFCIKPKEKNGVIAPLLIILSVISIIPGLGAFTISRTNQINRLQTVLEKNNMLNDDSIIPNVNISDKDRQTLVSSITYLNRMDYTQAIAWLSDYSKNHNFEKTFGFPMYGVVGTVGRYITVVRERRDPLPLEGYDFLTILDIYNDYKELPAAEYVKADKSYSLRIVTEQDSEKSIVLENEQTVLISFPVAEILKRFADYEETASEIKKTEEVTFVADNDKASIKIIVDNLNFDAENITANYNGQIYVLAMIK